MVIGAKKKQAGLYWHLASVTLLDSNAIHSPSEHGRMNHCVFTPVCPVSGFTSSANALKPHRLCQHWSTTDSMHFTVHSLSQHDPIFSLFRQRHLNDSQISPNRFRLFMLHEPLMAYVNVCMHVNCWKTDIWSKHLRCRWDACIEWHWLKKDEYLNSIFLRSTSTRPTEPAACRQCLAYFFSQIPRVAIFDYIRST